MEWINAKDFPQELTSNVQNLDSAISEIENVVNMLTSMPLNEAHSAVSYYIVFYKIHLEIQIFKIDFTDDSLRTFQV